MKQNTKAGNRIVSLALSIAVLLSMVLVVPGPVEVYADTAGTYGQPNDGIDFATLENKDIYFGTYLHATDFRYTLHGGFYKDWNNDLGTTYDSEKRPILWRVMGEETTGKVTMLSEYALDGYYFYHDYITGTLNQWEDSDLWKWLNTTGYEGDPDDGDEEVYGFLHSYKSRFTDAELNGPVADTHVTTTTYTYNTEAQGATQNTTDRFYIPWGIYSNSSTPNQGKVSWSADDTDLPTMGTYELSDKTAKLRSGTKVYSWLRSPYSFSSTGALSVEDSGKVNYEIINVALGVRPAFQLNPSSVLFTSEIVTSGNGDGMGKIEENSDDYYKAGNYKLTIVNDDIKLNNLQYNGMDIPENGIAIDENAIINLTAQGDTGTILSYKIVGDSPRRIVGYGQADVVDDTNFEINTSSLSTGDYTVYVWAQKDYEKNSNEGSTPQYFPLRISNDSHDATLKSVAGKTIVDNGESGSKDTPLTATINFDKDVEKIKPSDIIPNDSSATFNLYSDSGFTQDETEIQLTPGADTDIYIKVVAQDEITTLYYHITVQRAAPSPTLTMQPVKTTLQVGNETNGTVVAKAKADNFSDNTLVTYSIEGTKLPDGLDIDTDGTITVIDADALEETPKDTYTVKAEYSTEEATDDIEITILDSDAPEPKPEGPKVYEDTLTVTKGDTATFQISLGHSGNKAATADIASDDESVATAIPTQITPDMADTVTVNGVSKGSATITVTFSGGNLATPTDAKVSVTVLDSGSGGNEGGGSDNENGSSTQGSDSGGGSSNSRNKRSYKGNNRQDGSSSQTATVALIGAPGGPIYVGDSFALTPSPDTTSGSNGWKWDSAYLSATFNSPATFTALQAGTTTITYTNWLGTATGSIDVTILDSSYRDVEPSSIGAGSDTHNPDTGGWPVESPGSGQVSTAGIWLLLFTELAGAGLLLRYHRPRV